LRVRGIEGLRIADTSVLPSLVNAGTYALALMTGERAAAFITGN
jgi:choline dehydrogenase-like flavoprotein